MASVDAVLKMPNEYARVCFVSADFNMSTDVQRLFNSWFDGLDWLIQQNIPLGQAFIRKCGDVKVIYLVITQYQYVRATYENLQLVLADMYLKASADGITKIAFPNLPLFGLSVVRIAEAVANVGGDIQMVFV